MILLSSMTDAQIIEDLFSRLGSVKALAHEMSVSRQTIHAWRANGLTPLGRFMVSAYARKCRIKLPDDFMERGG